MYFTRSGLRGCTGCQVHTLTGHIAYSVAFAPDGMSVIIGSSDKIVEIWDFQTGVEVSGSVWDRFEGGEVFAFVLCVLPKFIFFLRNGLRPYKCSAWQVRTLTGDSSFGGLPAVFSVSPDGKRLGGSCQKLVKIWDLETGAEVSSIVGVR